LFAQPIKEWQVVEPTTKEEKMVLAHAQAPAQIALLLQIVLLRSHTLSH